MGSFGSGALRVFRGSAELAEVGAGSSSIAVSVEPTRESSLAKAIRCWTRMSRERRARAVLAGTLSPSRAAAVPSSGE